MKLIYSMTDSIFSNSHIFDKFRNFVHNGFDDEKNMISRIFSKNKKTLDFGCGAGQLSVLFNQRKYHGIDTDKKYIEFCKLNRKGNFSVIKYFPPYDFKSKYFDQILVSSVIHHIDDESLLKIGKELKRILKDNGELMIIDHFAKKNQKNIICKFLINMDRGNNFRDLNEVIKLFSRDFKVKKTEQFRNSMYRDYALVLSKK